MVTESVRYALILGGLLVLGFNAAVIVHAAKIVSAVRAWRAFILGKSGLTAYVLVSLYEHPHDALGWREPLAGGAIAVTLISLFMLDHSYRRHAQAPPLAPWRPGG